jgi:GH24 family phage-related lysozyme (muramidase)
MSHVKSDDPVTSAAPFIPADLEMTLDGISGIIMGNGFTIPANRLPISLRETTGNGKSFSKVGFIVTGLTHTIQSNEWLTRIKGQMIKLRTDQQKATANLSPTQTAVIQPNKVGPALTGNIVEDAVTFIKSQEKLYSAQKGAYVELPSNSSQNTLVYAYTSGGDIPTIGWGTVNYNTGVKKGQKVALGDNITVSQADAEIHAEVAGVSSYIKNNLKVATPLTNGQSIALISLGYNLGVGNLSSSPIWKNIEGGQSAQSTATLIATYGLTVKATGQVAGGLIARRKQESQLFLS